MTLALLEGSEAIADGHGRGRMPVLRRLPDDPVHRGARAHGQEAAHGRRHVHERRERARGGRHGVGGGRDRHPERHRLDRPGAVADAGVARRAVATPGCRSWSCNMARAQGDYWQATRGGATATRASGARADGRARGRRPRAARVPPRRHVAQPGPGLRRLLPRPHLPVGRRRRRPTSARCPTDDWALDGTTGGTGQARLVSPARVGQAARRRRLRPRPALLPTRCSPPEEMLAGIEPRGRDRFTRRRRGRGRGLRHPRQVRALPPSSAAIRERRRARRLRPPDHPVPVPAPRPCARAAQGRGPSRCTRTTRARWSTTSASRYSARRPSSSSAGLSLDSSGFGIGPDITVPDPAGSYGCASPPSCIPRECPR